MTEELPYLPPREWYEANPAGAAKGVSEYKAAGLTPPAWLLELAGVEPEEEPVHAAVQEFLPEWQGLWDEVGHNAVEFFTVARDRGLISQEMFEYQINRLPIAPWEEPGYVPMFEKDVRETIGDVLFDKIREWFRLAYQEVLVSLWRWMLEKLKDLIDLVVGTLKPILSDAWEFASAKFEEYGRSLYDGTLKVFEGHSPVKPEDAPVMAMQLYLFAMGMGMAAHGTAALTELLHPLKTVGLHQTAAAIGDFAGFGRISAATMGPLVNRVLAQAMTYAVQSRYRPVIPDDRLLVELRSKREIDKGTFDKAMAYQGFDDDWIDLIERWQWKDPRTLEIARLADVGIEQGPPPAEELEWFRKFGITGNKLKDWWLYRKFMRAGYEDCDLDVLVRFIHRKEVSFALTYVRTAIRRNYRWGYLTDEELEKWMERLNLPEQAKEWIFWAGELDREYFYRQDLQNYYITAFRQDVIGADELLVSLLAMNLPAREASLLVRTEKIRKRPKTSVAVPKEQEQMTAKLQSTYIQLYREQFKKGFIDEALYLESLLSLGLDPELASVTVELDATKRVPALE